MDISARVGPQINGDGSSNVLRQEKTGGLLIADVHGRYYEAASRGKIFLAHNVAAQAVSVGLATTYTGLMLSNPMGSGKNLALLLAQFAVTVAEAAIASQHLIGGYSVTAVTHTTPLAAPGIQCSLLNGNQASVAKVDSAATIPTPGYIAALRSGFTAAALAAPGMGSVADFGGMLVVPPGGFIGFGALTAITGFGMLAWEEVDI